MSESRSQLVRVALLNKMDEFSEKFKSGRGGVIFESKDLCCRFWTFLSMKLKTCNMRGGVKGRLELFRKFIRFGDATRP